MRKQHTHPLIIFFLVGLTISIIAASFMTETRLNRLENPTTPSDTPSISITQALQNDGWIQECTEYINITTTTQAEVFFSENITIDTNNIFPLPCLAKFSLSNGKTLDGYIFVERRNKIEDNKYIESNITYTAVNDMYPFLNFPSCKQMIKDNSKKECTKYVLVKDMRVTFQ